MIKIFVKIKKKIIFQYKWLRQDLFFLKQHFGTLLKKDRIILCDTANHDNLGDHAIAVAEKQFVEHYLPAYGVIEIPGGNILRHTALYRKFIRNTDVITIAGGGFLGSLWPYEEKIVQTVLNTFQNNKTLVFPQTFWVDENEIEQFRKDCSGYMKHRYLRVCLRDEESCLRFNKVFPEFSNPIFYMPDLVCGLKCELECQEREGVGLCFRRDVESLGVEGRTDKIGKILSKYSLAYNNIDTMTLGNVHPKDREKRVYEKLREFAKKKLVVTDRLHAMLFSVITNTPCLAFNNKSGKVKGVYKWISNQGYVFFVESLDEFKERLELMDLNKEYIYNDSFIKPFYKELSRIIRDK